MGKLIRNGISYSGAFKAAELLYDNSDSGLVATQVQDAIDSLAGNVKAVNEMLERLASFTVNDKTLVISSDVVATVADSSLVFNSTGDE